MSWVIEMSWFTHESPGLKPDGYCWEGYYYLNKKKSELKMIFSKTFPQIGKSDTGQ